MKGRLFFILLNALFLGFQVSAPLEAQEKRIYEVFLKFSALYNSGNYIEAEKLMEQVLAVKNKLPDVYVFSAYNNLGLIKKSLGNFKEAIDFYNIAEELAFKANPDSPELAGIYTNKSRIYTFRRSYPEALEYIDKAVRMYMGIKNPDKSTLLKLSGAYNNYGIILNELKNYKSALEKFNSALRLKMKYGLAETELVYLNIARTYEKLHRYREADENFNNCLNVINEKYGSSYFRMAEVLFGYGTFLDETGRDSEALIAFARAIEICIKNYGEKHSMTSLAYKYLGDYYFNHNYPLRALENYQESLISITPGFSDTDFFSNPSIDSSLLDIRLLDVLKKKAEALYLYRQNCGSDKEKINVLKCGLLTADLAMMLADRIRNNYPTEESRIFLAGNEKETALTGIRIACSLHELTGADSTIGKMYEIVSRHQAVVLLDEIAMNEFLPVSGIPDSVIKQQKNLAMEIGVYNDLIINELKNLKPDSSKIGLWKDDLFRMNREMERLNTIRGRDFNQYRSSLLKRKPVSREMLRKKLSRDETVINYFLSGVDQAGKRELYIFVITRDGIRVRTTTTDTLFAQRAALIKRSCSDPGGNDYSGFTASLSYMYRQLIRPVEDLISGRRLIIIPDGEIAGLPFDAFLMEDPLPGQTDFSTLDYLIRNYTISFNYSASLVFDDLSAETHSRKVIAFAPGYTGSNGFSPGLPDLQGTVQEIRSIYRHFRGRAYTGPEATETNFRLEIQKPAIFHLAMHALSDTTNSGYSTLLFSPDSERFNDGRLFNYEISLARIHSPMVVLSACNSGTGILYNSEGLMSIARGFLLAGASSVIRTSWEVNDEVSASIIGEFYRYLKKGKNKDDALRMAKLQYMKKSPPAYSNPNFWATYEVLGSTVPVISLVKTDEIIICTIILSAGALFYLRRRRIFAERSL